MLLCVCLVSVHEPVRSVAGGVMYVHVGAIERERRGGMITRVSHVERGLIKNAELLIARESKLCSHV